MPYFLYASFPNSRNKIRPPTTNAETFQVPLVPYSSPLTQVAKREANRTYIILKNLDLTNNFWYVYADPTIINPTIVPTFGLQFDTLYYTPSNQLYQKQDNGETINWLPVSIQNVGLRIEPLQSASLDSPEAIYAATDSNVVVVPAVIVGVDQGFG